MVNSNYIQNAAKYRSLAETAESGYRSMLLTIASEWQALADAADTVSTIAADHSEAGAA
jgi:hypothetical protein